MEKLHIKACIDKYGKSKRIEIEDYQMHGNIGRQQQIIISKFLDYLFETPRDYKVYSQIFAWRVFPEVLL